MITYVLLMFANLLWTLYCIAYFLQECGPTIAVLVQNPQANILANPDQAISILTFVGANYYKWLIPTIVMFLLTKFAKASKATRSIWDDPNKKPFFVPRTKAEWAVASTVSIVIATLFASKYYPR